MESSRCIRRPSSLSSPHRDSRGSQNRHIRWRPRTRLLQQRLHPRHRHLDPTHVIPAPRRAHTAAYYKSKIWIFGGGNGMQALNDVWTLDVGVPIDRMRWDVLEMRGRKSAVRGYHTANLIGNIIVIVGGSGGKECFQDIWCLNLGAFCIHS
jgi:hypothetical protein